MVMSWISNVLTFGAIAAVGIALLYVVVQIALGTFFTVDTAEAAVVTRFSKFIRVAGPGLHIKIPVIDAIAGRVSLKVVPYDLQMETKTKDNVFVTIPISVQVKVREEKVFDAFYRLSRPQAQIRAYVEQVILGHVPSMTLDELFERRSEITGAVQKELKGDMEGFGYEIINCQVTDIVPDPKVKDAMNAINAAERQQVAASAKGEADKILVVKAAQAEAESKKLQGEGIANQRIAIARGLRDSIAEMKTAVKDDASVPEIMQLVLITQYFDTLKSIGQKEGTNTLFLSHSPGSIKEIGDQITQSILLRKQPDPA